MPKKINKQQLEELYNYIEQIKELYLQRNMLVALLTKMAIKLGIPTGWGTHEDDGDVCPKETSFVIYFDLPSGQVSFHCPLRDQAMFSHLQPYDKRWDRHGRELKWERINDPWLQK